MGSRRSGQRPSFPILRAPLLPDVLALVWLFPVSVLVGAVEFPSPPEDVSVLAPGFGRTGTSTFAQALVDLGYTPGPKIYNMRAVLQDMRPNLEMWEQVADEHAHGRPIAHLFRKMFAGSNVVSDYPACAWWEEIWQAFPRAKLLLTTRDAEEWYASSRASTFAFVDFAKTNDVTGLVEVESEVMKKSRAHWIDQEAGVVRPDVEWYGTLMQKVVWDRLFGPGVNPADPAMKAQVMAGYERHVARIREIAAKRVEWTVAAGSWTPLCDLLDVSAADCPTKRLPHANPRNEFYQKSIRPILQKRLKPPPKDPGEKRGKPGPDEKRGKPGPSEKRGKPGPPEMRGKPGPGGNSGPNKHQEL